MSEIEQESWAIVELMGHVKMAGRLTEEERFGSKLGRIDIPADDGGFTTVYFGGSSVYRITPVSEAAARIKAHTCQPEPVHAWDLPQPKEEAPRSLPDRISRRFDDEEDDEEEYPL